MRLLCALILCLTLCSQVGLAAPVREDEDQDTKPARGRVPPEAVTANNEMALDLYARLSRENTEESLFFSPYSISNALVIAAEGARGETAEEMGKVLRLPRPLHQAGDRPWKLEPIHTGLAALNRQFADASRSPPKTVRDRLARLRKDLAEANRQVRVREDIKAAQRARRLADEINNIQARLDRYEVRVANALWGEKTYPFKQSYLDTINKYHGAAAFPVDFINAPNATRKRINAWVQKQTRDRIKDLIPPRALNKRTRLVVANAIYFKGRWTEPFQEDQTKQRSFTLAGGKKVKVATMHGYLSTARYAAFNKDGSFFATPTLVNPDKPDSKPRYPDSNGFEMLEMPYKGGDISMVVIVPRSADGLPALEKTLTAANLKSRLGKLRARSVEVFLPKYRLESSFDLGRTLKPLGMKRAFDPGLEDGAQFEGMSKARDPEHQLYISKVLHKAFVEVGEKGTEAAAAAAVIKSEKKSAVEDCERLVPFTPIFKADKPFLFLIRDQKSGTILFLGRVLEPKTGA
jgi:serine protease inhibitor